MSAEYDEITEMLLTFYNTMEEFLEEPKIDIKDRGNIKEWAKVEIMGLFIKWLSDKYGMDNVVSRWFQIKQMEDKE